MRILLLGRMGTTTALTTFAVLHTIETIPWIMSAISLAELRAAMTTTAHACILTPSLRLMQRPEATPWLHLQHGRLDRGTVPSDLMLLTTCSQMA